MPRKHSQDEEDLWRAIAHPLRRALLKLCLEAQSPISPKRLSELTDHSLSNVSYHVRVLVDCGAVEVAGKQPVRGSTQHFYDVTALVRTTPWIRAALG
jgi:DNA-binding transcriptional ArsR family regulator